MKNTIFSLVFLCFVNACLAQKATANDVLLRAFEIYEKATHYKMNMTYNIYADDQSASPKEVTKAVYYKEGASNFYMKMDETEKIFIKDVFIVISHSEKAMMVSRNNNNPSEILGTFFKQSLKEYSKTDIKDYKTFWRCTLYPAKGSPSAVYKYVTIDIAKNSYNIIKQKYFFNVPLEQVYGVNNSDKKEVLEIIVNNFDKNTFVPKGLFNSVSYYKPEGKNYVATGKQKGYEIISDSK